LNHRQFVDAATKVDKAFTHEQIPPDPLNSARQHFVFVDDGNTFLLS
jgi:hypothetical protein